MRSSSPTAWSPTASPGPMTYMQLNRASGVDEPRLQTRK